MEGWRNLRQENIFVCLLLFFVSQIYACNHKALTMRDGKWRRKGNEMRKVEELETKQKTRWGKIAKKSTKTDWLIVAVAGFSSSLMIGLLVPPHYRFSIISSFISHRHFWQIITWPWLVTPVSRTQTQAEIHIQLYHTYTQAFAHTLLCAAAHIDTHTHYCGRLQ